MQEKSFVTILIKKIGKYPKNLLTMETNRVKIRNVDKKSSTEQILKK